MSVNGSASESGAKEIEMQSLEEGGEAERAVHYVSNPLTAALASMAAESSEVAAVRPTAATTTKTKRKMLAATATTGGVRPAPEQPSAESTDCVASGTRGQRPPVKASPDDTDTGTDTGTGTGTGTAAATTRDLSRSRAMALHFEKIAAEAAVDRSSISETAPRAPAPAKTAVDFSAAIEKAKRRADLEYSL